MEDTDKLTRAELEAIGRAIKEESEARVDDEHGDRVVLAYDLVGAPSRLGGNLPRLELLHTEFCRLVAEGLRRIVGEMGTIMPVDPRVTRFGDVYGGLRNPTVLMVLSLDGLATTGLLLLSPELFLRFVDRMLGGTGPDEPDVQPLSRRGLTSTERTLLERLLEPILESLEQAWADVVPLRAGLVRMEADPRHALLMSPTDFVVQMTGVGRYGPVEGTLTFLVPMAALRPVEKKLAQSASSQRQGAGTWRKGMGEQLLDVKLEMVATLGSVELPLKRVMSLTPGDLLRLDTDALGPLTLSTDDFEIARGRPSAVSGAVAIEVDEILFGEASDPTTPEPNPPDRNKRST